MKSFPCGVAWTLILTLAMPASAQQILVAEQSEIAFTSAQMGVPVNGRFKNFAARIAFDPRKPEASRIEFTIDVASASFGVAELDAELAKAAWFDARRFPQATFRSVAVKEATAGKFDVIGRLAIKSVVRDLVVPVAVTQTPAGTTATGAFTIRRLDFGIGEGDWKDTALVSNEVQVKFKLLLAGVPAK